MSGPYSLTTPCDKCPFRSDVRPFLRPERVWNIYLGISCHKTTSDEEDENGDPLPSDEEITCAGFLIMREHAEDPTQMMRIAERLGFYDRTKLNMDAPVYSSVQGMYEAYRQVDA